MIAKLKLKKFGRYLNQEFNLGATTLFYGENEAGKSTLFDALFYALCKPKKNQKPGKELRSRYGDQIQSEAIATKGTLLPEITEEEFLHLYSIRSGSIHLEFSGNWLERVKSNLFSHGIDPGKAAEHFTRLSQEKGNLTHVKAIHKKSTELKECREELRETIARRDAILGRRSELSAMDSRQKELNQKQVNLDKQIQSLEELIRQESEIMQRQSIRDELTLIRNAERAHEKLKKSLLYSKNSIGELDLLQSPISQFSARLASVDGGIEKLREDIKELEREILQHKETKALLVEKSSLALNLLTRIQTFRSHPPMSRSVTYDRMRMWTGGIVALTGTVAVLLLNAFTQLHAWIIFSPTALILIGLTVALLSRKEISKVDAGAEENLLNDLCDSWKIRFSDFPPVKTLNGMEQFLQMQEMELSQYRNRSVDLEKRSGLQKNQLQDEQNTRERLIQEREKAQLRVKEWLTKYRVQNRDQYIEERNSFEVGWKQLNELIARWETRGRAAGNASANSMSDREAFLQSGSLPATMLKAAQELERKLAEMDRTGVEDRESDQGLLSRCRNEISELRQHRKDLEHEFRQLAKTSGNMEGELGTSMTGLNREIHKLEQRIVPLENELEQMALDRKAAARAATLFSAIASDQSALFREIAGDFAGKFSRLVERERAVELNSFQEDSLAIEDAGGTMRSLSHLSSGSRDAFVFATRLALAKRNLDSNHGDPILILDDPFITLDEVRVDGALKILGEYQQETKSQLIFFTKDPSLAERIEKRSKDIVRYNITETL